MGDFSATALWKLHILHDHEIDGRDIVIAILDTGIDVLHPAFTTAFKEGRIRGANFIRGEPDDSWMTVPGAHGVMAMFVAGGSPFGNVPCGVAPAAKYMVCRIGSSKTSYSVSAVIDALKALVDLRDEGEEKLHVVSMSFGMPYDPESEDQRTIQDLILKLKKRQVICVASAGNYGTYRKGIQFPACSEDVICVGALNAKGHSRDSNAPTGIDVYAPGELIPVPSIDNYNSVAIECGSSCAAPAIAGLIALIFHYANKCVRDIRERKKFRRLLYLKFEVFDDKMKDRHPNLLDPYRFFESGLREYEQQQEIDKLKRKQDFQ